MSKSNLFREAISKMMDAVTLDDEGNMKVLDESAMSEADELISQMVVETARDWWAQLESAEDSLADMADEISFSELNADPSHIGSQALDVEDEVSMGAGDQSLEGMLEGEEFDLSSIFEGYDEDMEEGMHMEDDEEIGMDDGDEDFGDLMRGDDDEGLGDDTPMDDFDNGMDAFGSDEDDFGMDDEDDGFGDMGGDDMGDDEFDFDFLDDEDDMEEMDHMDEMKAMGEMDDMEEMDHLDEAEDDDDEEEDKDEE